MHISVSVWPVLVAVLVQVTALYAQDGPADSDSMQQLLHNMMLEDAITANEGRSQGMLPHWSVSLRIYETDIRNGMNLKLMQSTFHFELHNVLLHYRALTLM